MFFDRHIYSDVQPSSQLFASVQQKQFEEKKKIVAINMKPRPMLRFEDPVLQIKRSVPSVLSETSDYISLTV